MFDDFRLTVVNGLRRGLASQRSGPPVVRQPDFGTFWNGPLDPVTYSCLASFPFHGANLRVYSYDLSITVPTGIELADARTVCPDTSLAGRYFADGNASHSKFSNLFRYQMMRQTGLCWVDADLLCLGRPDFRSAPIVFGRQFPAGHAWSINGAVLKLPKDSALLDDLIANAEAVVDVDQPWGAIGPLLITEKAARHGVDALARDCSEFYPLDPDYFWMPLLAAYRGAVTRTVAPATFLHLWHNRFNESGYDTSARPQPGSYLHEACALLGTLGRFGRDYDPTHLRAVLQPWIDRVPVVAPDAA